MTVRVRQRSLRGDAGFTLLELLVSSMIMVLVTGAIFGMMNPATGTFQVQPEVSDMQQRLRVGIDTLQKDLVMAGAGIYSGPAAGTLSYFFAPIMPYRAFGTSPDPENGVFYRSDTISLMFVPPTPSQTTISDPMPPQSAEIKVNPQPNCPGNAQNQLCGFEEGDRLIIFDVEGNWDLFTVTQVQDPAAHLQHQGQPFTVGYAAGSNVTAVGSSMYYLFTDNTTNTYQLRYFDGWMTDLPVVDNVVKLEFKYYGDPLPPQLTGKPLTNPIGPWTTYGPKPPELGVSKMGWPAGENCTFQVVGGQQVPRLATLGAGGLGQVEITENILKDGPWCPDPTKPNKFDADLLRIRRVRATVRVQAALASLRGPAGTLFMKGGTASAGDRFIPDQEVSFDVAPRNLNLGR
jgi:prepilin-type N-terminal cleavage/methylation domain-containing protein